jgi:hypothetical protein
LGKAVVADQVPDTDLERKQDLLTFCVFLEALAIGLGTIILTCVTTLPDACDHPKLMTIYSKIIRNSTTIGMILLMPIVLIRAVNIKFNFSGSLSKNVIYGLSYGFVAFVSYMAFVIILSLSSNYSNQLPRTYDEAITFCEGPEPDQEDAHPMLPLW